MHVALWDPSRKVAFKNPTGVAIATENDSMTAIKSKSLTAAGSRCGEENHRRPCLDSIWPSFAC